MPPWAANLPELGEVDSGQVVPEQPTDDDDRGDSTAPSSTVAPADSIVADDPAGDPTAAVTTSAPSAHRRSGG